MARWFRSGLSVSAPLFLGVGVSNTDTSSGGAFVISRLSACSVSTSRSSPNRSVADFPHPAHVRPRMERGAPGRSSSYRPIRPALLYPGFPSESNHKSGSRACTTLAEPTRRRDKSIIRKTKGVLWSKPTPNRLKPRPLRSGTYAKPGLDRHTSTKRNGRLKHRVHPAQRSDFGRVGMWRGGLGAAYLFPPLSSGGASIASPCSVSTSRSSNRTCGFPASGSPTDGARRPRTQLVIQAHKTLLHKALAPFSNGRRRSGQTAGNGQVGPPVGGQQNDLCPTNQTLGSTAGVE